MATPSGIWIGQVMTRIWSIIPQEEEDEDTDENTTNNHSIAIATVKAMVAGTFLYIAIVEIGSKELLACRHGDGDHGSKRQKQLDVAKLICFVVGFLMMSGLALFV